MDGVVSAVALVLFAGILALEFGISTAILELIFGATASNLLSLENIAWMGVLANIGTLGIMFFAGFETDLKILAKNHRKSILIALGSYVTPFIFTFFVVYYILGFQYNPSILLAIGMSTTSLAIVYPYLESQGFLKMEIGQTLLGSAMLVDLLSMLSVSILFTGIRGDIIVFLIAVPVSAIILPKIGLWIFKRYEKNRAEVELRFILLLLVALALVSEYSGVHSTIFAYIMGVIFSSILTNHEEVEKKLRGLIYGFFGPLFFFNSGYLIDLKELDFETIQLLAILTVVAFTGKYIGTRIAVKKILGRGSRLSGLFFNFRLTFGIIIALLGYQEGIISKSVYTAMLGVVLLTSIISSIFLKVTPTETIYLKRRKKRGKIGR
ncbi:MAG: cation:proton antiporter [Candidatus Altiarchaeota archaeon]|nr:cation:proton antiporter [Candidatus Altiarchaeota archaeon]